MWILILVQMALANTVMVKAPTADTDTYQVFIENSDNIRPSEMETPCSETEDLRYGYTTAKDNFVSGSVEMAKKQFQDVVDKQWRCDWHKRERTHIGESFMRLAQLATNETQINNYLKDLAQFDPSYVPATHLFPPPLLDAWKSTLALQSFKTVPVYRFAGTFVKVLRNGQAHSINSKPLRFPAGQARYTFLSDSHMAKTVVLSSDEIVHSHLQTVPFLIGDCKSFQFVKPPQWKAQARLFFAPECVVDRPENTLLAAQSLTVPNMPLTNSIDMQLAEDRVPKKMWIQKNAVWIGAAIAVIGTAIVVAEMNKRKETQTVITPSTSINTN